MLQIKEETLLMTEEANERPRKQKRHSKKAMVQKEEDEDPAEKLADRLGYRVKGLERNICDEISVLIFHSIHDHAIVEQLKDKKKEWRSWVEEFLLRSRESIKAKYVKGANNDKKKWNQLTPECNELTAATFELFRKICNIYSYEPQRAGVAAKLLLAMLVAWYDSHTQGYKPVYNKTQSSQISLLNIREVLRVFDELQPYYEQLNNMKELQHLKSQPEFDRLYRTVFSLNLFINASCRSDGDAKTIESCDDQSQVTWGDGSVDTESTSPGLSLPLPPPLPEQFSFADMGPVVMSSMTFGGMGQIYSGGYATQQGFGYDEYTFPPEVMLPDIEMTGTQHTQPSVAFHQNWFQ